MQQRKRNLEVDFLRQKHQLSTEDIRNRLYEELYHTTLWKDARSASLESSVHNMSALLKMRAEIDFLWPIFRRVRTSVNMRKEIWNIVNFLERLTAYIVRSQSGTFPDRMQSFQMECCYLFEILQLYYTIGPYTFQSTTCKSEFIVASMVYKMREFTYYKKSLSIVSEIDSWWRAICLQYRLWYVDFGSSYHYFVVYWSWMDWTRGIGWS
ncbi:hypothetical protein GGI42DRAFT_45450 [Trichoderma sp. SZMC 28013]